MFLQYTEKGSKASLIAGGAVGALFIGSGVLIQSGQKNGVCMCVLCVCVCVCVFVCVRLWQWHTDSVRSVPRFQYPIPIFEDISFFYWSQLAGQNKKGHLLALGTSLALLGKKLASGKSLLFSTLLIDLKDIKSPFVRVLSSNSPIENPIEIRVSRAC